LGTLTLTGIKGELQGQGMLVMEGHAGLGGESTPRKANSLA
jgi:hypothetical protein